MSQQLLVAVVIVSVLSAVLGCGGDGQKTSMRKSATTTRPAGESVKEFRVPAYPWVADGGDGTYLNPILCADYSDPDAIRVGDDFYLTASSFNCTPGLPILHSKDLVNWTIVNYAIKDVPGARYDEPRHGEGVWAPAIRYHDGKYWIFFPTPDEGIYVTTAADPRGEWSEPWMLLAGKGLIDPCPLWDEDGKAYLVHAYAKSRAGIKDKLHIRPMSPDGRKILGEGKIVYDNGEKHRTLEGPKFLKKDGWYYILAPAGGVPTGYQLVFRSKDIYGPYEDKKVLAQGSTPVNGPHQGALVDLKDGEWWFLHFQESQPFGRIVHLQPVTWKDGWPLMGVNQDAEGVGEPVGRYPKPGVGRTYPVAVPQTSDEFDSEKLGLQWQWHANAKEGWYSLSEKKGSLRLYARHVEGADFAKAPNLLLQKLPAKRFFASTKVTAALKEEGERAGLIVMGLSHGSLYVKRAGGGLELVYAVDGKETVLERLKGETVGLGVQMEADGVCTFAYRVGEQADWRKGGSTFQAKEGRWIGAKVGVFAVSPGKGEGVADFEWFRFAPAR